MLIWFVSAYELSAMQAADTTCVRSRLTEAVCRLWLDSKPMRFCFFFPQITTELFSTDKNRQDLNIFPVDLSFMYSI